MGGVVYSNATVYLFRTDDGGHNWAQVSLALPPGSENTQLSIEEIQFVTPSDGFLSMTIPGETTSRALYVTHDAGANWTLTPTLIPNGRATDFVSAADGFVFNGDQLYVTHDAAQTWTIIAPDILFGPSFMTMDFVDPSTGWITTSDPTTFAISLYKTTDGGATWLPQ